MFDDGFYENLPSKSHITNIIDKNHIFGKLYIQHCDFNNNNNNLGFKLCGNYLNRHNHCILVHREKKDIIIIFLAHKFRRV